MSVHSFNGVSNNHAYYSHGQIKVIKSSTSYLWTINNFCICRKKNGEVVDSPIISAGADGEHRWRLLLYPKGRNEDSKDHLSIYLFLVSCNESKIDVQVKFAIINDKHEEYNDRRIEQRLHKGKGAGCSDFIRRDFVLDKANGLLPNGNLTIYCEIGTGMGPVVQQPNLNHSIHELSITEKRLSDDLEHLYETGKYSDITLVCKRQEFRAHKSILATRSPVLAALFDVKVKNGNKVEIDDLEPEVVQEMLRFIYTAKTDNGLHKMASELLVAAEKYAIEGLKSVCEDVICKNLTVDNAVDVLILADVNKAERLKNHAIGFIIAHAKDVVETQGYRAIADSEDFRLLAEVFRVLALQNDLKHPI